MKLITTFYSKYFTQPAKTKTYMYLVSEAASCPMAHVSTATT